jgi:hypothetical protein
MLGDGISHTQLVAANLALSHRQGAVVLLNIAKAFDTIGRTFLLSIIGRCSGGHGMRQ